MTIINRRKALALVPSAITALVPLPAAAKVITVRKICPVERYWANWKKADADYIRICQSAEGTRSEVLHASPEYIEAHSRMIFNQKLLANAVPTTIGGMIALCEYQQQFLEFEINDDQLAIAANMITSLKQLPT